MADFGRISNSIAEAAITVPAADAKGRVSAVIAEAVHNVPAADAAGRISTVIAEVVHDLPAADTVGRLSTVIAEAIHNEVAAEARVAMVHVEVFSKAPTPAPLPRKALGGGVQGPSSATSSIRRRR